jgi:hypothetical protein
VALLRRRRIRLLLIALTVLLFVAVSALLARAFSIEGAERSAITELVTAEARGDAIAMIHLIVHCGRQQACRAEMAQNAARLRQPGRISIGEINPSAGFSLTSTLGVARVVWRAGSALPVTQCVRVRRAGDVISGLHVELLAISRRIRTSSNCPGASDSGI